MLYLAAVVELCTSCLHSSQLVSGISITKMNFKNILMNEIEQVSSVKVLIFAHFYLLSLSRRQKRLSGDIKKHHYNDKL